MFDCVKNINPDTAMPNDSSTLMEIPLQSRIVARSRLRKSSSNSKSQYTPSPGSGPKKITPHGVDGGVRPQEKRGRLHVTTVQRGGETTRRRPEPSCHQQREAKRMRLRGTQGLNQSVGTTLRSCALHGSSCPTHGQGASLPC